MCYFGQVASAGDLDATILEGKRQDPATTPKYMGRQLQELDWSQYQQRFQKQKLAKKPFFFSLIFLEKLFVIMKRAKTSFFRGDTP